MAQLGPEEEQWREVYTRLCERFPNFTPDRVLEVLRKCGGHAGQTAASLRDLQGTAMRPVDPDDVEHVKTLLSSPMIFGQACKDEFRKFDKNGDGVLDVPEVCSLVSTLYENFGLEAPREGSIRAFFEANDANHDGVLNEKEFNRFFEMFMRYAFFDVVQHQEKKQADRAQREEDEGGERPAPAPPRQRRSASALEEDLGHSASEGANRERPSPTVEKSKRGERRSRESGGGSFRCVATDGVAFRGSADLSDRLDKTAQRGETVQALEYWIRTADGWLPLVDSGGKALFEKVHSSSDSRRSERRSQPSPTGGERLQERFPEAGAAKVAEALLQHGGHAGQAAKELRDALGGA